MTKEEFALKSKKEIEYHAKLALHALMPLTKEELMDIIPTVDYPEEIYKFIVNNTVSIDLIPKGSPEKEVIEVHSVFGQWQII